MSQSAPSPGTPERRRSWLLASTEGQLLLAGLAMACLLVVALGIAWHLFPDDILRYVAMTGLNLFIGRAAGMSFGYASGFTHEQVVPFNMLVETIQVLIVYPLFALSWRQLVELRRLKQYVARMHTVAESRSGMVRRFGIAGLFVFVFLPFWMTGPVERLGGHRQSSRPLRAGRRDRADRCRWPPVVSAPRPDQQQACLSGPAVTRADARRRMKD